jgi:hypothetical protein
MNAQYGIALSQTNPVYSTKIFGNNIFSLHSNWSFFGITVQDQLMPPISQVLIYDNTIYTATQGSFWTGFNFNSCQGDLVNGATGNGYYNYQIYGNAMGVDGSSSDDLFYAGFQFTQNKQIESYNNTVGGGGSPSNIIAGGFPQAYYSYNNEMRHRCNTADGTFVGAGFYGTNNNSNPGEANNPVAQGFSFENNTKGLWITQNATIPNQFMAGNKWSGIFGSNSAAENDNGGNPGILQLEQFTASPVNASPYWPLSNSQPSITPSIGWFGPGVGSVAVSCPAPARHSHHNQDETAPIAQLNNLDTAIIEDSIQFSQYNSSLQWQNSRIVYDKLVDNTILLSDSGIIDSFYFSFQNSSLGQLSAIEHQKNNILALDSASAAQLGMLYDLRDSISQVLMYADTLITDSIYTDSLAQTQIAAWQRAIYGIDSVLDTINAQVGQITELVAIGSPDKNKEIEGVIANNDNIETVQIVDANLKQFYDIFLSTSAQGIDTFTADQISSLYYLANQCPLSGGEAVFRARSLLTLIDDSTLYYNDNLCSGGSGDSTRMMLVSGTNTNTVTDTTPANQAKPILKVILYPNPAKDYAVLQLNQDISPLQLQIIDGVGGLVINQSINTISGYYTFSTSSLASGLYYVSLYSGNSKIFGHKLAIFR